MENSELQKLVQERALQWTGPGYDEATRAKVIDLMHNNKAELTESFYRDLEFGTGGLRGIMGTGTNRMNIYTVGMATQGICNYMKKVFKGSGQIKVAIAHDSRNNSRLFSEVTAKVFSANDFKVYLFEDLRPTPELSFAIRHFGCQGGVVITASHNPKEYNGYKAYWDDGAQVIAPHDKLIIEEVKKIRSIDEVNFSGVPENIEIIGHNTDEIYTGHVIGLSLSHDIIRRNSDMKIVYTPIHGSGVKIVPMALKKAGFESVINVPEQDVSDGNFPTVHSPNPEESSALAMAIEKAAETGAELVMATDPDADRVGIVVRDKSGKYIILNGNQAATLLIDYLLGRWAQKGKLTGNEFVVKTIVTTDLLADIAIKYGVDCYNVLTGFKYIADIIRKLEGRKTFIAGGEESYGYLAGDFVRDKDAVVSCLLIAEAAAFARDRGQTLFDRLMDIYHEFGLYSEKLISVERKGKEGTEEIQRMMEGFRKSPPSVINNSKVIETIDYLDEGSLEKAAERNSGFGFPKSDVIQFFTADGSKVSVRPSGTEPKIKFYFAVKDKLKTADDYPAAVAALDRRVKDIIQDIYPGYTTSER